MLPYLFLSLKTSNSERSAIQEEAGEDDTAMCMEMLRVITAMCMDTLHVITTMYMDMLHVMLLNQLNAISLGGQCLEIAGWGTWPTNNNIEWPVLLKVKF